MIFLTDQPPRVNQLRFLIVLLLLALILSPSDRIIFFRDTPDTDAAVYTLCTTARPVQTGSAPSSPPTPAADCALFVSALCKQPEPFAGTKHPGRVFPTSKLILRC